MAGTNAGTGQPITARCSACRRRDFRREHRTGYNLTLTGKRRKLNKLGRGGIRMDANYAYQYRCGDCRMVGWSRHKDLANRYSPREGDSSNG